MPNASREVARRFYEALKTREPEFARYFERLSTVDICCGGCGIGLSDDISRARGFGPECYDTGTKNNDYKGIAEAAVTLVQSKGDFLRQLAAADDPLTFAKLTASEIRHLRGVGKRRVRNAARRGVREAVAEMLPKKRRP